MALVLVTPPSEEPVALELALRHVRQDALAEGDPERLTVAAFAAAARRHVEEYSGRQLLTARWRLSFTGGAGWDADPTRGGDGAGRPWSPGPQFGSWAYGWPEWQGWSGAARGGRPIPLPRAAPLGSVVSVQYTDVSGVLQTLLTSDYRVDEDSEPAWLWPAYGRPWPACRPGPSAFRVTYDAGWPTAAQVPGPVVSAILLTLGHLYDHHGDDAAGLPPGIEKLLGPFCVLRYV